MIGHACNINNVHYVEFLSHIQSIKAWTTSFQVRGFDGCPRVTAEVLMDDDNVAYAKTTLSLSPLPVDVPSVCHLVCVTACVPKWHLLKTVYIYYTPRGGGRRRCSCCVGVS